MSIRSAAKAIILNEDRVLLIRCRRTDGSVYYNLPGGGQDPFEPLEDALRREVMEETGCAIEDVRFAALYEEIDRDPAHRASHPEYCHRLVHLFSARLADAPAQPPSHPDMDMDGLVWMPIGAVKSIGEAYPVCLSMLVEHVASGGAPLFTGTHFL